MVDVLIVGGRVLFVVEGVVVEDVVAEDGSVSFAVAASQLIGEKQAVVLIEIVFSTYFETSHKAGIEVVFEDRVV